MKRASGIILIACLVLCMCSCTNTGSNSQITIGVYDSVCVTDPLSAATQSELIVSANCFEGLLRLDDQGDIDLGGAVKYTAGNDGLTYTFNLNEDAKWYIPAPAKKLLKKADYSESITAEDYIFGIKRFIDKYDDIDSVSGADKYTLAKDSELGIVAPDEYTLVITLQKIDVDFLYKLATLPIYPCNETIYNTLGDKFCSSADYTVSNGPYIIQSSDDSATTLERSSAYSGAVQVTNKYVSLCVTDSESTMQKRFNEGTYDVYLAPSTTKVRDTSPSFRCTEAVWGIGFNTKSNLGNSDALRSILLSSINYDNIDLPFFAVTETNNIIPYSFLINDSQYGDHTPEAFEYTYDIEAAKNELQSLTSTLGYTTYTVDFAVPAPMESSAKAIAENWETTFGDSFAINLIIYQLNETETILKAEKYDMAILPLVTEARTALGMLESLSYAPCNLDTDEILPVYKELPTEATVAAECNKAEKVIINDGIFVPLFTSSSDIYFNTGTQGIYLADGGKLTYLHSGTKTEEK